MLVPGFSILGFSNARDIPEKAKDRKDQPEQAFEKRSQLIIEDLSGKKHSFYQILNDKRKCDLCRGKSGHILKTGPFRSFSLFFGIKREK